VDVIGFPVTAEYTPQLIEGTIRRAQEVRALAPLEIRADADHFGRHDSELVSVTARLLDRFTRGSNDVLVLQAGDFSFEAEKPPDEATDGWLAELAPQSLLKVTGVCVVLVNQASTPRHFKMLLRTPSDAVVLSTPSIWEDGRFRMVATAAVLLVITPIIWVALLRRKVRQQTSIIRAQLAREQLCNEELELKVHDRTRALSELNEKLRHARDELESRVEKRTAELSHANHALREEVAERERSEQALRISEERFSKAFRCSPVPMGISHAENGVFLDVNEALARALGCGREDMLEPVPAEINVWANPDDRLRALEMLREEEPVRNWQVELRTINGEVRHALVSMEKIIVKDVTCLLILFNDVTERVQLEAQFRHSQKMEAVGQLAAGIAHDFNNILTVIQGHVGLLLVTIQNQEHAGSLNEVSRAADRAADLTRQLLTFSRRQPLLSRTLDLNQVISSTSQMLRRILSEQISLSFRHAPSLPAIHADQGMIEQIILNLAVNARDAMPNGGRLEFVTSARTTSEDQLRRNPDAAAGEFVCMDVTDTGCGMDAITLSRIFEPFFTTKEVGKGTGLGLATVYGIVKQHGGWIEVASEVNRGTQFTIYFPAQRAGRGVARGSSLEASVHGGSETILLVEDEPGVRELARSVLGRYGYTVLCAANGIEALETWERSGARIDLLLTDMVMPEGLSGRELAARLRSEAPGLKILFTSGYSVELEDGGMPLKAGVNFLPKPYPARQLAAQVRRCLDCDCAQEAPA
jgi:PAS domain S-box-containing protein